MVDYVNLAGRRVMIHIEDGDIEDTEGYNPGEVTFYLYPKDHALIFQLSSADIPERFSRHPASIMLLLDSGEELMTQRFDARGIAKLRNVVEARSK